ncbi:MAG: hypothetical protein ACT4PT_03955, partial [Methanobacteriota archaeon]
VAATSSGAEERYAQAVRWALVDRTLTAAEERSLVLLAEDLGIPASKAYAIRDDVERANRRPHP